VIKSAAVAARKYTGARRGRIASGILLTMPLWASLTPIAAAALLVAAVLLPGSLALAGACGAALLGSVIAAVHHAEVIAHRLGEPFGALVLAVSITTIEVALIVTLMLTGGPDQATLPRDTIFATIMIICNGVIGLCLLTGALRHQEQVFPVVGNTVALATLLALTTLSLVLPTFTTSSPGPTYNSAQLLFAALASLLLWGTFVFVQSVRHRDYFLPLEHRADEQVHAALPSVALAWASFGMLFIALAAVVGLAKLLSPSIETAVAAAGAPKTTISVAIALLVLLPETTAALRAARANRLQTSFNLALGSALASIGLTIPAVAFTSMLIGVPLILGLDAKELVFLVLTGFVTLITFVSGRGHVMTGAVHLVIFGAFLFLALVP
jgi:Ca2+:H+ antiporter